MANVPCALCRTAVAEGEAVTHQGRTLCRTCFQFSAGPTGAAVQTEPPAGGRTTGTTRRPAGPIGLPPGPDAHFGPTVEGQTAREAMFRPRDAGPAEGRRLPEALLPIMFVSVIGFMGLAYLVTGLPRAPQPSLIEILLSVPFNLVPALFLWAAARIAGVATATYVESLLATASANYTFYFFRFPVAWLAPADPVVRGLLVLFLLVVSSAMALVAIRHFYVVSLGRALVVWLAYVGICVALGLVLAIVLGLSIAGFFLAGA